MIKLRVSTHSKGRNKQEARKLTFGWHNRWLDVRDLAAWVSNGYAWAGTHFKEKKRCAANANGSNCLTFDFDGELSLERFWTTKIAKEWCALTYTSASHTEDVNRFRAVFPLEGLPIQSAWVHKSLYQWLELELSRELQQEFQDSCGNKPERLWFGNSETSTQINDSAFIPYAVWDAVPIPPEPTFSRGPSDTSGITDLDVRRCVWLLENFIAVTEDGEYNSHYLPVTAACAAIGSDIEDAWVSWVAAGHHGTKQSNMDASLKWAGLGLQSGPSSLYAIAKRQDPQWARKLPAELRFNPGNDSGLCLDAFLSSTMNCVPQRLFRQNG